MAVTADSKLMNCWVQLKKNLVGEVGKSLLLELMRATDIGIHNTFVVKLVRHSLHIQTHLSDVY